MEVDDIIFSRFVDNGLPQSEMKNVEKILVENGEINATLQASILNYELHQDLAAANLGVETEEKSQTKDRIALGIGSDEVNNGSLIFNATTMNGKLSKEEILKIQNLVKGFNDSYDVQNTLDGSLMKFYLEQRPGAFPEDAVAAVKGLKSGIDTFNSNLQKALAEGGLDYASELQRLSTDLPLSEKYELYINFLAALQTLSMANFSAEQLSQIEDFRIIHGRLSVKEEVTEDMLADVEEQIDRLLKNNTLCLGSIEALKGLMDELPNGTEAVERVVTNSEQDVREKLIASMAVYIAFLNGEIDVLQGQDLSPEAIAISTAAGMEEMRVMNDLHAGRTTLENAIKVLKIIGGIALFALLAYVAFNGIMAIGTLSMLMFSVAFGSTAIATIGAIIASALVVWALADGACSAGEKIMQWSSKLFDWVVKVWRETAWPTLKEVLLNLRDWFSSLFHSKTVACQEQQGENEPQTVSGM